MNAFIYIPKEKTKTWKLELNIEKYGFHLATSPYFGCDVIALQRILSALFLDYGRLVSIFKHIFAIRNLSQVLILDIHAYCLCLEKEDYLFLQNLTYTTGKPNKIICRQEEDQRSFGMSLIYDYNNFVEWFIISSKL